MIDLVALVGLFGEVFGVTKNWTTPSIARFERLEDVEQETVVRELKAAGFRSYFGRAKRACVS